MACAPAEKPAEPTPAPQKIVLGAMFPLTGDGAAYGEPISRQMMLAVDEINAAGGINGQMLEIKLEDSKCNPKDGATAASKLIDVDKVKIIFGGACSGETLGAAPIAEQAKVILISPSATSPDITTAGDYIFRTAPSDAYAAKVAAEKALAMGFKKAATINENGDYPQGLQKTFAKVFTEGGGQVVATETYNPEDTDFKTQAIKSRAANPDVIYVAPQAPAKGILLIKQIKQLGMKQQLMTAEVLIGRDVVKDNAGDLEGIIGVEAAFDENGKIASKALSAYKEKHNQDAPWPFYQAAIRDAVYLIANAVKDYGDNTEKIKAKLYSTKDWEGAIGNLTIDQNGDPLLGFSVKQVVKGELVELK